MDAEWYSGEQVAARSCVTDRVIQIQGKEDIFFTKSERRFWADYGIRRQGVME